MTRLPLFLIIMLLTALWLHDTAAPTSAARASAQIAPSLARALSGQAAGQPASAIVVLKNQENVRAIRGSSRADRQRKVIQALRKRADADQKDLIALMRQLRQQGHLQSFTPLWIYNAIVVSADSIAISQLAQSPAV